MRDDSISVQTDLETEAWWKRSSLEIKTGNFSTTKCSNEDMNDVAKENSTLVSSFDDQVCPLAVYPGFKPHNENGKGHILTKFLCNIKTSGEQLESSAETVFATSGGSSTVDIEEVSSKQLASSHLEQMVAHRIVNLTSDGATCSDYGTADSYNCSENSKGYLAQKLQDVDETACSQGDSNITVTNDTTAPDGPHLKTVSNLPSSKLLPLPDDGVTSPTNNSQPKENSTKRKQLELSNTSTYYEDKEGYLREESLKESKFI